jgi:hypothetical protein
MKSRRQWGAKYWVDIITPPNLETDACEEGVPWTVSRLELPEEAALAEDYTLVEMDEYLGLVLTTAMDGCVWIMSYV